MCVCVRERESVCVCDRCEVAVCECECVCPCLCLGSCCVTLTANHTRVVLWVDPDLTLDPMDLISQPTALELMFRWWSPS